MQSADSLTLTRGKKWMRRWPGPTICYSTQDDKLASRCKEVAIMWGWSGQFLPLLLHLCSQVTKSSWDKIPSQLLRSIWILNKPIPASLKFLDNWFPGVVVGPQTTQCTSFSLKFAVQTRTDLLFGGFDFLYFFSWQTHHMDSTAKM